MFNSLLLMYESVDIKLFNSLVSIVILFFLLIFCNEFSLILFKLLKKRKYLFFICFIICNNVFINLFVWLKYEVGISFVVFFFLLFIFVEIEVLCFDSEFFI